ncbi:cyclin-dependent kinase 17-like [Orbicella faveolata]|uniref:cyclin-dependent kinase 17-like n=1 Tax=Orbicella faveolata TaxID=48498 RepID=UPI0009E29090|nr:cyclin-dependent kinase 17-like [Orbicella faveolata]
MKKIKRALSLKGKGVDDTLSELAEQMSLDVNGKDNGFDHQNGPIKDEFEAGVETADEFLQVPMRKPRSKSTVSAPTNSSKRLSLPVLHYGTSLNDISMRKSPAHRTRSSTEFGSSKSPPYGSEQHLSRRSRRMSLSELGYGKMETYVKLDKLGEGTYATVFKGKSKLTDNLVALKEIRLEHEEGAPCTAIREVSLLKDLKHANIVTLHDIVHTPKSLTLVFEYLEKDLKQYMDDCGGIMSMTNVRWLIHGAFHCILSNCMILICRYRPPDVLLGSTEYSTQIDMWGVGCIFFEMATGRPFFPGSTVEDQLHLIFKTLGTPTEDTWPGITSNEIFLSGRFPYYPKEHLINHSPRLDNSGLDLLERFVEFVVKNRISASDAMRHDYFSCLGKNIRELKNIESIFNIEEIRLTKDPGYRPVGRTGLGPGRRRQSMLF